MIFAHNQEGFRRRGGGGVDEEMGKKIKIAGGEMGEGWTVWRWGGDCSNLVRYNKSYITLCHIN